jgi:hypothetical protein
MAASTAPFPARPAAASALLSSRCAPPLPGCLNSCLLRKVPSRKQDRARYPHPAPLSCTTTTLNTPDNRPPPPSWAQPLHFCSPCFDPSFPSCPINEYPPPPPARYRFDLVTSCPFGLVDLYIAKASVRPSTRGTTVHTKSRKVQCVCAHCPVSHGAALSPLFHFVSVSDSIPRFPFLASL